MPSSEKEKMLAGELYRSDDPALVAERRRCRALLRSYNEESDEEVRRGALHQLFGSVGDGATVEPPFACDYGYNISLGAGTFINYGAIVLDVAPVVVGDQVQIGTAVQIPTADHPREPELRRRGLERALSIEIEDNAWLGSGAILCPGVTIGANSIVGAGSVVTRAIPANVLAAGNPCRVIREL
jgi:maltose O-acetyltransferase